MKKGSGRYAWFAGMWSLALMLVGCAGHVDLQQLAETPDELVALQQFKSDHPEADKKT